MSNKIQRNKRQFENLSVLIVDDNRFFRSLIRTVLREFGVRHIQDVEDGADALAQMDSNLPDLVLLDWYMPLFSGADFMQIFNDTKRSGRFMPSIIVVTANATKKNVIEATRMGVDGILCKPIVPAILYKRILDVVDLPKVEIIGAHSGIQSKTADFEGFGEVDDDQGDDAVFLL